MSTVSIIGSGSMAAAIAHLSARAGHNVVVMSRNALKAHELVESIGAGATTGIFGDVPAGNIVILAVPYAGALDVVRQFGEALADKILVDITNPVSPDLTCFVTPTGSSGTQEIAKVAPTTTKIVKAFNTQFSHVLAIGAANGTPLDILIAGDDLQEKSQVADFIESLGLHPMDCGPLIMSKMLEHVCLLALGLVTHSFKHTRFSLGVKLNP
ncbi:NADPH-dependent F420 reductase [Rouxiella sp. WC2420]|uniref:NADPH-dependent F420 reductase n=1 Tax=Rouxiella sp. WC2420 TaxID=3234145 RepID=A0AB39VMR0_9GAMM